MMMMMTQPTLIDDIHLSNVESNIVVGDNVDEDKE